MKVCPKCGKSYADDSLNFCLDDGSILTHSKAGVLPETVIMNRPLGTEPNHQAPPTERNPQIPYSMQPKRSSKAWLWVVGILGAVVLLCGGGFAALLLVASSVDTNTNQGGENTRTKVNSPQDSPVPSDTPADVQSVDLSRWVEEFSPFGSTSFTDNSLVMSSKQKGYYYVLVASNDVRTADAATRVALRNLENANASLGYGLIFHSDPVPLARDFAFLIDSAKQRYRVVRHEPQKEITLIGWTQSEAIRQGSRENILEVRDKGDDVDLYINGMAVNSIKDTFNNKNGVAGLYAGDAAKIAFQRLEIRK